MGFGTIEVWKAAQLHHRNGRESPPGWLRGEPLVLLLNLAAVDSLVPLTVLLPVLLSVLLPVLLLLRLPVLYRRATLR